MEADLLKYGWLIVLTLGQIILAWVRIIEKRNHKKNNNPGNHGERIAKLEEAVENIEKRMDRFEDKLNSK